MRRALDPFAFPSETRGWFRMLVLASLLVSMNIGYLMKPQGGREEREERELAARVLEVTQGRDLRAHSFAELQGLRRQLLPITREMLRRQTSHLALPALFALILLTSAAVLYRSHPTRMRRRHRARPLLVSEAPRVVGYLQRCAANLGLPPLRLEYKGTVLGEARAFGLRGQEVVLLDGTPELLERSWGDTSKAIALHEIGHIYNRDCQIMEKISAVWSALLALVGLVFCSWGLGLGSAASGGLRGMAVPACRLVAMLLVIRMIWAGLVSVRELYADRRVAEWGGSGALEKMLRPSDAKPRENRRRLWRRWWRQARERADSIRTLHPSPEVRWRALADPVRLFRVSPHLAFVAGVLLSLLLINLFSPLAATIRVSSIFFSDLFLPHLVPPSPAPAALGGKGFLLFAAAALNLSSSFGVFLLAVGGVSYLLSDILGVQVQREAVADLVEGKCRTWGYGRLWWPAFLLALGLETGFLLAPFSPGAPFALGAGMLALWLAGLTGFTWLWLSYVRALTRFALGLAVGASRPRRLQAFINGSAVVLLTALYGSAGFWRMTQTLWAQQAAWTRSGVAAREFYVYMYVGTGVVLMVFALVVYIAWAAISLSYICLRLWRWKARCPCCKNRTGPGFILGRRCEICREPLATWAYAGEARDPGW